MMKKGFYKLMLILMIALVTVTYSHADDVYKKVGQKEISCTIELECLGRSCPGDEAIFRFTKEDLQKTMEEPSCSFKGEVAEKDSIVYLKPITGKLKKLFCNNKQIELNSNDIKDGFVSTKKFGRIIIGLPQMPECKQKVHLWLTSQQKRSLKSLKQK